MILQSTIIEYGREIRFEFDDQVVITSKDNPGVVHVLAINEIFDAIDQYIERLDLDVI
jgi:sorbitol-specific phosphotransferase system component IIA